MPFMRAEFDCPEGGTVNEVHHLSSVDAMLTDGGDMRAVAAEYAHVSVVRCSCSFGWIYVERRLVKEIDQHECSDDLPLLQARVPVR